MVKTPCFQCKGHGSIPGQGTKIPPFELWCWRRLLRVPWTARRSNQSILKEINPEYSLEGVMLKFQYFGHLMKKSQLIGKDPDAGKDWRQEEKGTTEDEMVGWHHWLDGYEFEQIPGNGEGQGSLACCSPWGRRVGHDWATEQLGTAKTKKHRQQKWLQPRTHTEFKGEHAAHAWTWLSWPEP